MTQVLILKKQKKKIGQNKNINRKSEKFNLI